MLDTSYLADESSWLLGLSCAGTCLAIGVVYLLIARDFGTKLVKSGRILVRSLILIYIMREGIWRETYRFLRSPRGNVEIFFTCLWVFSYVGLIESSTVFFLMTLYVYYLKHFVEVALPKLLKMLPMMNKMIAAKYSQSEDFTRPDSDSEGDDTPPHRTSKVATSESDDSEYK